MDINNIIADVKILMSADDTGGHGFDHVEKVYKNALKICRLENADANVVALASLLHDCDDYKLFGQDCADNLSNAKMIMNKNGVAEDTQFLVCDIIHNMGYSKSLKGIRPQSLEGKIVSDADMLEAIGAVGMIRCLSYALARCQKHSTPIFDADIFPELSLTSEEYKKTNRKSDNFINHFFEKLLKIKSMMFTKSGFAEAELRHQFMTNFLYNFFRENDYPQWIDYLNDFEQNFIKEAV